MDILKKQRVSLKGKVTRLETFLQRAEPAGLEELLARLEILEETWVDYNKIHNDILQVADETQTAAQEKDLEGVETKYLEVKAELKKRIKCLNPTSTTNAMPRSDVKLPRITLPSFSGNVLEWSSFRDLFTSLIHTNVSLSASQKLHYLKNAATGEASSLVQSIETTDANYVEAWKLLLDRYENKRQLIQTHLASLFGQKKLMSENPSGLRSLIDNTVKQVRSLHALQVPTDHWDQVLVFLVTEKLDSESRKQWELSTPGTNFPSFRELREYLEQRCRALEASGNVSPIKVKQPNSNLSKSTQKTNASSFHANSLDSSVKCIHCKGKHSLYKCQDFLGLGEIERTVVARKHSLCFNCLRIGHSATQCLSTSTCKQCGQRHHSLLHFTKNRDKASALATPVSDDQVQVNSSGPVLTHFLNNANLQQTVLLATAVVHITDRYGHKQSCRALIDSGSQASFITEACVQKLGLRRARANVQVVGIGQTGSGNARGIVDLKLTSTVSDYSCQFQALVLEKVTGHLPSMLLDSDQWEHLKNLQLADPNFSRPGNVDLLLGADVYSEIILGGKISGCKNTPTAFNTKLGWIMFGRLEAKKPREVLVHLIHTETQEQLRRFWEIEELKPTPLLTQEERECEERFRLTTTRDSNGRFTVHLPIKQGKEVLGLSKDLAIKRLMQVERRLECMPHTKEQYRMFMQDYEPQGHMERIPLGESSNQLKINTNYLPHHFVTKQDSTTTKLRVVFDASARTTTGYSLNDQLLVGPKIQDDLWDILLRFRFHKYAFMADIKQMYRQIRIAPSQANLQRIVWRDNSTEPIKEFRLMTVTYGTASAPFLATRVLKQLAEEDGRDYPLAKEVVLRDFYMDDLLSGADTMSTALLLQKELIHLLRQGGFVLRKWAANDPEILAAVPEELLSNQEELNLDSDSTVKSLGVYWRQDDDSFMFKVNLLEGSARWTKRSILSEISRIYDPLGWVAPVIILAKVLIQKLWLAGVAWDDPLPSALETEWQLFRMSLSDIASIRVTRYVLGDKQNSQFQLHGFCDASESAYAAVVYTRSVTSTGGYSVQLLCAKTKVSPIKQISLPRLELCGAVLLARLLKHVQRALHTDAEAVHAWTDSTVTLSWILGHPRRWKTFVANRVATIQGLVPPEQWHHVSSRDNPADVASRGSFAKTLAETDLWWYGPKWLRSENQCCVQTADTNYEDDLTRGEERFTNLAIHVPNADWILKYSKLTKLKRVTAYCLRFAFNAQSLKEDRIVGPLNAAELHNALLVCVRQVQRRDFHDTITALETGKKLSSDIQGLNPFVDEKGLLRVGGRIRHANIPYNNKFPIILPKNHHLTELIVQDVHLRQLHSGAQATLAALLRSFWIVNGRSVIRRIIFRCHRCFVDKGKVQSQLMGDLPAHRLEPVRSFIRCGIDFGGPFHIRTKKGRGGNTVKSYVCLFVCLATKAIHLELATDLTSESFLGALKRFVARRGKCTHIYSDNGTNFVGANRELKELKNLFNKEYPNQAIADFLSGEGIVWHFSPPRAPHFGGLWEAGIKSTKTHLRRVLGETRLTYEELNTVLTQVEACLNSRPLTPMSNDPSDFSVLTPGHFLIGDSLTAIPEPNLAMLKENRLSRWQLTHRLAQHFWKRWRLEYLSTLQQRSKWRTKTDNLTVGDLVLLKEEGVPPLEWTKGRIIQTHPGKDNLVRVVSVKTAKGVFKRPIVQVCPLPTR